MRARVILTKEGSVASYERRILRRLRITRPWVGVETYGLHHLVKSALLAAFVECEHDHGVVARPDRPARQTRMKTTEARAKLVMVRWLRPRPLLHGAQQRPILITRQVD